MSARMTLLISAASAAIFLVALAITAAVGGLAGSHRAVGSGWTAYGPGISGPVDPCSPSPAQRELHRFLRRMIRKSGGGPILLACSAGRHAVLTRDGLYPCPPQRTHIDRRLLRPCVHPNAESTVKVGFTTVTWGN